MNFFFPEEPDKVGWNQQVGVYFVNEWEGNPQESEEMLPKWFKVSEIPYDQMWEDDPIWLPKVLAEKQVRGNFLFNSEGHLIEHSLIEDSL